MIDGHFLSYEQTVNRGLAHRRALGEVLVADSVEVAPDRFLASAQIPRAHLLWGDRTAGFHEPLAMVEACRQATFVVAHRHLLVPQGPVFIMQGIEFNVTDLDAFRDNNRDPLEGIFRLKLLNRQEARGGLTNMDFGAELLIAGVPAMMLKGGITFLPPADYEVFRAFGRAGRVFEAGPPASPIDVGLRSRSDARNVVIGNPIVAGTADHAARYRIVVDQTHPSFYDHPQDHAPGPLLLEAARQTAIAEAVRTSVLASLHVAVTACRCRFDRFAEHDAAIDCSAVVQGPKEAGPVVAAVRFDQMGQRIARINLELSQLT
jgi:hypothetical protein